MRKYFIHNLLFRILAAPVYGLLVYLLILLINNNVSQINELFTSKEVYVCIGLTYMCFGTIRIAIVLQDKFLKGKYQNLRIPIQFVVTTVLSVGLIVIALQYYFEYVEGFSIGKTQLLIFVIIYTITALLYNILYLSSYYMQKENTIRLTAEKHQREILETEINEFRSEINPDLLYESLENLITLIYKDVEKAEEYIDALANAYRYVLTNRHQELVPISVEVEACKNLIRLLNERFYGQLKLEHQFDAVDLNAMLIPGSLPLMVENMARNTIFSRYEPMVIRLYREDDYITLQGKLNDRLILHAPSVVALERLQKSYALYSDKPLIRVKAYEENYIKLPVIEIAGEMYQE